MHTTVALLLAAGLASATPESTHYEPEVGDILLFQSPGGLRNIAYFLGCSAGVTHSALVVARPDGTLGMLEAPGPDYPVMISDIPSRRCYHKGRVWVRKRKCPVTPEQSRCLTEFACRQEGKPFYTLGVLIPMFGKPIPKHRHRCVKDEELEPDRWFCSPLVVAGLIAGGLLDRCAAKPWFVDPQDLKTDHWLDLSCGWQRPYRWLYCGDRAECWFSISCAGKKEWWK
ncbi:MAG: hypothetical protein U0840_02420 [Gemmataceae bacterium]